MKTDILKLCLLAGTAIAFVIMPASAQQKCGLCAKEIVINSELATCFLQEYPQLAGGDSPAVAVDLSSCTSRGVVEPLPSPNLGEGEPDTRFMLSRAQLTCLKAKLEDPNVVLDPSAKIELSDCG